MGLTVKVSKTRNASARELSRRTADLLDEIEQQGIGLVVIRFGRPAALLVPLEPKVRTAPRRVVIEEAESPKTDDPIEMPELRDDDRRLLLEMARCAPDPYCPDDWAGPIMAFCAAFTRLELEGLAQRDGSGRWITTQGERVADVVAGDAEASAPAEARRDDPAARHLE
jgi:antitoxin (DNA-binding transcriptional repressor) of toxin-antitoxin stability system